MFVCFFAYLQLLHQPGCDAQAHTHTDYSGWLRFRRQQHKVRQLKKSRRVCVSGTALSLLHENPKVVSGLYEEFREGFTGFQKGYSRAL